MTTVGLWCGRSDTSPSGLMRYIHIRLDFLNQFLDGGFYLASGSLPVTRFFCTLNNSLPEMEKEHRAAIAEGKPAYLVVRGKRAKGLENYQLIDECSMVFEGREWTYYLYRRP